MGKGRLMPSAAKLNEASNIFKLHDLQNNSDNAASGMSEGPKETPAPETKSKESRELGNQPLEAPESEKATGPAAAAPDDALAWLKIIENATADLTADLRAAKRGGGASSADGDESSLLNRYAARAAAPRGGQSLNAEREDYPDERKLAQKLSYKFAEPRSASPQTLRAALMPYIAATAVVAFITGCAAAYFLTGASTPNAGNAVTPGADVQVDTAQRPDQPSSKKGALQRAQPVPADSQVSWGSKVDDQVTKQAEPGTGPAKPLASWSDTVETFKQFVKPEQKPR